MVVNVIRIVRLDIIFFSILGLLISTIHWDVFYYAYDTPKWFVFDLSLSLFVICNRKYLLLPRVNWFGAVCGAFFLSIFLLSFKAAHTSMAVEFTYRYFLVISTIYVLNKKYSGEELVNILQIVVLLSAIAFVLVFYFERYYFKRPYNVGSFSTFGFINNVGQVYNIWLPVLIWLVVRNYRSVKYMVILIPLVTASVSILMEASVRGSIFGLFIGEGVVFLIVFLRDIKKAFIFLSTSIALLIGIFSYNFFDSLESGRLSNKLSAMENTISASQSRLNMFSNTFDMIIDNKLGVGTNNFEYYHPYYGKPEGEGASPYINENQILRTPHNIVLKVYSEQGLIGGTIFLLMLIWVYLKAIRNAYDGDFYDRWLCVACTALFFHSLLSAVFLTPASLFFSILLFSLIIKRSEELRTRKSIIELRIPESLVALSGLLVVSLCVVFTFSDFYAYKGFRGYDTKALKLAVQLNPSNDRAWYTLSHIQYRKYHDVTASLDSIEKFLQRYPYHIAAHQIKSERLYQLGRYEDALRNTQRLLSYYPSYRKAQQLERTIRNKLN